jgi:hypothetical protein
MKGSKPYQNGLPQESKHFYEARKTLIERGTYYNYDDCAAFTPIKSTGKHYRECERFVAGDYEFIVAEYKVTVMGADFQVGALQRRSAVYYQPLKKENEKCTVCNYEREHHSLCPNAVINSDAYEYQRIQS